MGNVLKAVDIVQLTTSFTTIYTVPGSTKFTVTKLILTNTTAGAVTVQVCVVPNAGSVGVANAILWNYSIAANTFFEITKGDIWGAGTTLQALAGSGTSINLKLAGIETS